MKFARSDVCYLRALSYGPAKRWVEFEECSMTPHGSAILTLWAKRQWSVDNPMPQFAEQVCALNGWQVESLATSVEECAEALFDYDAEPGEYELSYYTWSDGIPFVFDGARRTFRRQAA
jgi:hypothetical protein